MTNLRRRYGFDGECALVVTAAGFPAMLINGHADATPGVASAAVIKVSVNHCFAAGHRILGLDGLASKCANLHGHTFDVEWTFRQGTPFIEFGHVKRVLRGWVDDNFDHGYIVAADDRVLLDFLEAHDLKHYTTAAAPTTEAIAVEIAEATQRCLPACCLLSVRVGEGPHNSARWERDVVDDDRITKRFTRTIERQRQS